MLMYSVSHSVATIKLTDYVAHYRDVNKFIGYCQKCKRFGACWACPPFDFDAEEYISHYQTAYIIGAKMIINKRVIKENTG